MAVCFKRLIQYSSLFQEVNSIWLSVSRGQSNMVVSFKRLIQYDCLFQEVNSIWLSVSRG